MIFHAVRGEERVEEATLSMNNPGEIDVIIYYITQLLQRDALSRPVNQTDIMVLTPYRSQIRHIKAAITKRKWTGIRVSSIEAAQGDESLITILSTVRSRKAENRKGYLGFLKNPKRQNVALTRARALEIIIGNPEALKADKNWNQLIEFCKKEGAWRDEESNPVVEHRNSTKKLRKKR